MSGGRKHVRASALGEAVSVGEGEQILRVGAPRGGNLMELEDGKGASMLCLLPAKFKRMLWLKRGSFVVADVSAAEEVDKAGGRVRGSITAVLFEHHIRDLVAAGQWPEEFAEATAKGRAAAAANASEQAQQQQNQQQQLQHDQRQQEGKDSSLRGEERGRSSQGGGTEGSEEQRHGSGADGHQEQQAGVEGEEDGEEGEEEEEDDGYPPLERNPNHQRMAFEDESDDDDSDGEEG